MRFIFLIALTGNYNHLRLHCSLGKVLVSSRAISTLLVYWLGKSEAGHSCFHSSLLDSVFIWCPSADAEVFSLLVWRQTRVKTDDFFLHDFTRATTQSNTLKYHFYLLLTHSPFLSSIMCFKTIPVVSRPRSNIKHRRQRNPANLCPISTSSTTPLSFSMALWNCQSAVNKADLISAFSLQSTLSILGLTETWIRPEDSATPAAISNNLFFSHTPSQVGRGGGTGLLISNNWKYSTYSPLCNYNSFESHAITVIAPIKS